MGTKRRARIVDSDGVVGVVRRIDVKDEHHPRAVVALPRGHIAAVPFELLEHHDNGGYSFAGRWADFARASERIADIPVIEEKVTVDVKPAQERKLRVRRRIVRETQVVETPVWRERLEVERVPVNEFVDRAPEPYRDGDVWVMPCVEEVAVVVKRLRVTEEVRVRVVREREVDRQSVEVRRHVIDIQPEDSTLKGDDK